MKNEKKELNEYGLQPQVLRDINVGCCSNTEEIPLIPKCQFLAEEDIPPFSLLCTGRILTLNITLTNVCPRQLINVAVLLCDEDTNNNVGIKVFTVDTSVLMGTDCQDIRITGLCFAIPGIVCNDLDLTAKVVAQYVPSTPNSELTPISCNTIS
ncbi:hypothetical protein ACQKNN_00695 [Bacillus paramycoides]|uniref:hypothetical protein n=1 Tax=Bacillus paramycoides TaxID=2026194 RepID=UPI003D0405EC